MDSIISAYSVAFQCHFELLPVGEDRVWPSKETGDTGAGFCRTRKVGDGNPHQNYFYKQIMASLIFQRISCESFLS